MTDKHCLRCGAAFACSPGPQCWCARLPPVMPMTGGGCFCPRCLGAEIDARVAERRSAGIDGTAGDHDVADVVVRRPPSAGG